MTLVRLVVEKIGNENVVRFLSKDQFGKHPIGLTIITS
jgi:hypothetical protein